MQGKALGALAALLGVALLVAVPGCGGDSSASSGEASSPATASSGSAQSKRPEPGRPQSSNSGQPKSSGRTAAVRQVRKEAEAIRRQREAQEGARPSGGTAGAAPIRHTDSGGGATQFLKPSGDNSIQESGVEASASEREQAAAVLHEYLDQRAAGHWGAACEYMAATLIVLLEHAIAMSPRSNKPEGCPAMLAAMSGAAPPRLLDELAEVDVGSLRRSGEQGFLLYHGPEGKGYAIQVVMEGGAWKVATLDGTVLP